MSRVLPLLAALVCGALAAPAAGLEPRLYPPDRPLPEGATPVTVDLNGNGQVVFQVGKVRFKPQTGEVQIGVVEPRLTLPDSPAQMPPGIDILIDPGLPYPVTWMAPLYPAAVLRPPADITPQDVYTVRPAFPNGLSFFFSTASGGIGMRIGYGRRLSPTRRFTAGVEFLTYGYEQSLAVLGSDLPPDVARISLISFPVGLRQEFAAESRTVPYLGFGAGPIIRFDHYPAPPLYGYPGSLRFGTRVGSPYSGVSIGAAFPLDGDLGLGHQSLTLGGFASAGVDIRTGQNRDFVLSLQARYTLAHFTDALGRPGDFSGLSLAVGFGKYF